MNKTTKRNLFIGFAVLALFGVLGITSCMKKDKNIDPANKAFSWPEIDFSYDTSSLKIGEDIEFKAETKEGSSEIVKWEWTFSDASDVVTGENPAYTYTKPGSYKVSLTGTDAAGITDQVSKDLTIMRNDTGILIKVMSTVLQPPGRKDYAQFYKNLADIINNYEPDFVVLRQADNNTGRNGKILATEEIGNATGMQPLFAKQQDYSGGGYGTGVLSRFSVLDTRVELLPPAGSGETKSVGIQTVQLDDKGHKLVFAGTELDVNNADNRITQANEMLDHVGKVDHLPIIAAGGFYNDEEVIEALKAEGFELGCSQSDGCPYDNPITDPTKTYQNIFYQPADDFLFLKTYVLPEDNYLNSLAVIAEFRYYPPLD